MSRPPVGPSPPDNYNYTRENPPLLRNIAGVLVIFALLFFFFLDLTTPDITLTQEMLLVMLGLIVALMGLDDIRWIFFGGGPRYPAAPPMQSLPPEQSAGTYSEYRHYNRSPAADSDSDSDSDSDHQ